MLYLRRTPRNPSVFASSARGSTDQGPRIVVFHGKWFRHTFRSAGINRHRGGDGRALHIRALTKRAYGYHSPEALIAMAMLTRGGLTLALPAGNPEPQRVPDHPGSSRTAGTERSPVRPSVRASATPTYRAPSGKGKAHQR